MNGCCTLSNIFSVSIEMIIWFFSFLLLIMLIVFANIEPTLHLGNSAHLIVMYGFFNILLHSVCYYFVEDFCICIHHDLLIVHKGGLARDFPVLPGSHKIWPKSSWDLGWDLVRFAPRLCEIWQ